MAPPSTSSSSAASTSNSASTSPKVYIKRYAFPIVMVILAVLWQTVVLPSAFPRTHYEVLGVKQTYTAAEISQAYERFRLQWDTNPDTEVTENVLAIQHAFEVLSDPLRRRDYDIFDVDELKEKINNMKTQYIGKLFSAINLPFLPITEHDTGAAVSEYVTSQNFKYLLQDKSTWLIMVYSNGSESSKLFAPSWKKVVSLLDGVAKVGQVELGEVQLASSLAESNRATGRLFFRYGLPSILAFPSDCRNFNCIIRYYGELNVDAIVDWVATNLLGLPRIPYYSVESLVKEVIQKAGPHKVKVIFFSKTGQRAAPFIRQFARDYAEYAVFAFVLWTEEGASLLMNMFGIESAPSVLILKDPGAPPIVHYGEINISQFHSLMEKHKTHALPQLRSINSMDLGCNSRGYSRAGIETSIWYCVIVVGRHSRELSEARSVLLRVQENLTNEVIEVKDPSFLPTSLIAAYTFQRKRLTLTWLDGGIQKKYCFFYLDSLDILDTCGPKKYFDDVDVPRILVIRYMRNDSESVINTKQQVKSIWEVGQDVQHLASQLVARYNGSLKVDEIISWISETIKNGDSSNLPNFKIKEPDLVPEEPTSIWSQGGGFSTSYKRISMKERVRHIMVKISDYSKDPRLGPIFFLLAALYIGHLWLQTKISAAHNVEDSKFRRKPRPQSVSGSPYPSSITDHLPLNAYQALETDSDSDTE